MPLEVLGDGPQFLNFFGVVTIIGGRLLLPRVE